MSRAVAFVARTASVACVASLASVAVFALVAIAACSSPSRPAVEAPPNAPDPPLLGLELVESTPIEAKLDSNLANADQVWLEMVGAARTSIDFAEFYASNGDLLPSGEPAATNTLEPIIRAIEAAMRRGVHVRFLADKTFVKTYPDTLARLEKAGATVRAIDLAPGILHAKYFIVDGSDAFLGSQNFDYRALAHNLELGVRIRLRAPVEQLHAIFEMDWGRGTSLAAATSASPARATSASPATATSASPAAATSSPASEFPKLVASPRGQLPPGVAWDLPALIQLVDGAKTRVRLQALTYKAGDWTELEDALVRATKRGVAVELLVADWAKAAKTIGGLQQLARSPGFAIKLVTVPAWSGGFVPYARVAHAKLVVADGQRGWVGTGNFERAYFYEDRNVGMLVEGWLASQLDEFFERTWKSPYATAIDPDATYTAPRTH